MSDNADVMTKSRLCASWPPALRQIDVVPALPKTRSGKILRKTMRGIAEGRNEPVPSTIDDPGALDALRPFLYTS